MDTKNPPIRILKFHVIHVLLNVTVTAAHCTKCCYISNTSEREIHLILKLWAYNVNSVPLKIDKNV